MLAGGFDLTSIQHLTSDIFSFMNIGITVYPTYGGSGIVGSGLGKELAERGPTGHFISSALPTRLTQLNERVRFHVAETEDLDLLHVHYAIPHSISAILARESLKPRRTLPVVTTLHGTDITLVGADRSYLPITRPVDCVEILARVRAKGVDARLVMVGDGSERSRAEHRARCLNVERHCAFVGKQPRITDYLSVADVLLLPSEQESFGLAALEASACEVPVIASRVGGIPEVVDDGSTGCLAEVGDVERMSDCAARLLSSEPLRREMGRRARASAVGRYSTDLVIPQYIEFYERVIAASKEEPAK